ncbi:MAG TPA: hypothetical protein VLI90_11930 [Tepidisphaeraceae bacterium]|nr:hypothetical protein [Tepidisphaeraceae bacterium]
MTVTLRAAFDAKVLVPIGPVDLPVGQELEIQVVEQPAVNGKSGLQRLLEIAEQFPPDAEAPTDGAAQHDHYLYGTPKREDP